MFEYFILAFSNLFQIENILILIAGSLIGYIVGIIPGLTPSIGIALLIPLTFSLEKSTALILISSLYMAAEYGGGITAILLNAPGTPAAAATAFDGYPMLKKGRGGEALALSISASAFGAFFSAILLILTAIPMANFALNFTSFEYFALALFGLCLISSLSEGLIVKALIALCLGLIAITIGMDPIDGIPRFAYINHFFGGIPFLPALIGLFALSEVFFMLEDDNKKSTDEEQKITFFGIANIINSLSKMKVNLVRSSFIGYIIGVIPGAGVTIASIVGYNEAKRFSKNKELFGKGNPEGIIGSEAANNASVSGSFAPLLALGIPGSASAAIIMGALTMQGVQPGPLLFDEHPDIPYAVFVTLLVSAPLLLVIGLYGSKILLNVTKIPKNILAVLVTGIAILGSYSYSNSMYPVWIMFIAGLIGYIFRKIQIPTTPIILAMVLGYMMEVNLRRGLIVSQGDFSYILSRPIALTILVLALITFIAPLARSLFKKRTVESKTSTEVLSDH